jgi:hypothetical protein
MLELLKTEIGKKYKLLSNKGVFFSFFDKDGKLIFSKGMVEVDKSLSQIIDIFHHNFFSKLTNAKLVAVDIVINVDELYSYDKLNTIDFTKFGIAVQQTDAEIGGIILPNTEGVADVKQIFSVLKKKNNLNGNIKVYLFQTDRILINL